MLAPVAALAAERGVALVVVAHTRKSGAHNADDQVMGSRAFTGLARSVLHVMADPDDPDERQQLLLPGKNNLAAPAAGLAFDIGPAEHGGVSVRWVPGEVAWTADEVSSAAMGGGKRGGGDREPAGPTEQDRAEAFIVDVLCDEGDQHSKELIKRGTDGEGLRKRTIERAWQQIRERGEGEAYQPEIPGPWYWRLTEATPPDQTAKPRGEGEMAAWRPGIIEPKTRVSGGDSAPDRQTAKPVAPPGDDGGLGAPTSDKPLLYGGGGRTSSTPWAAPPTPEPTTENSVEDLIEPEAEVVGDDPLSGMSDDDVKWKYGLPSGSDVA